MESLVNGWIQVGVGGLFATAPPEESGCSVDQFNDMPSTLSVSTETVQSKNLYTFCDLECGHTSLESD